MRTSVSLVLMIGLPATAMVARQPMTGSFTETASGSIEGIVKGTDGIPVEGAWVAAVPENQGTHEEGTRALALVRSSRDGGFRLQGVPAGRCALTATQPLRGAGFRGDLELKAGETLRGMDILLTGGARLSGVVRRSDGVPLPRAQVRALRYSMYQGDTFYSEADENGAYTLMLPKASYFILAAAGDRAADSREVQLAEDLRVDFELGRAYPPGPAPAEVVSWIRQHAIPLATSEAEHGFADLQPLKGIVGDAHLVALGEATHGTREFFQLKHRLLEFLASEMGFTIFGIEATMPEAFDLNEYVLTGVGDPAQALTGLYFWTWNTEEVLDLIRWMRRYNEDAGHSKKLKFYGFDMQFSPRAAKLVLQYLRRVDPEGAEAATVALAQLTNPFTTGRFEKLPAERKEALSAAVETLLQRFDARKQDYVQRTSASEWAKARQHVRILSQNLEMRRTDAGFGIRDRAMAENILWILEREGPGAKMVAWAHNAHVASSAGFAGLTMGSNLRAAMGSDLVVFGFSFNQGSFQAFEMPFESGKGLHPFSVGPAPTGGLDSTLATVGPPIFALDLRALPRDGPVPEWFASPHKMRLVGAGFSNGMEGAFFDEQPVTRNYDALLSFATTTSARPNPGGHLVPRLRLSSPVNLDFEEGEVGQSPAGWVVQSAFLADFGFTVATDREGPRNGKQCVLISRASGSHYGEEYGSLSQRLEAAPYRGKRLRLRASARALVSGKGSEAHLWLRVAKRGMGPEAESFYDGTDDRPITTPDWREYEIRGEVSSDADTIEYGLALVGDGRAWFDAVVLEVVSDP